MCLGCSFVDYNVRPPGGGMAGLGELDVVGIKPDTGEAFLCEVTTHIRGLLYGSNEETVLRIKKKHIRQREYASKYLKPFPTVEYMFWSPVVPVGYLTTNLSEIAGLTLVVNDTYSDRIAEIKAKAADQTQDSGNDFFRMLQIMERLRYRK
jgi:hypothetical protein